MHKETAASSPEIMKEFYKKLNFEDNKFATHKL